jgi:hypothetical protein
VNTTFTINFRREAYQRELARTRRRLFKLGGWLTYFGVLALVLGLYGLNVVVLAGRVERAERRVTRAQQTSGARTGWKLGDNERNVVEDTRANPARWPAADPIRPVGQFVSALKADSVFARGYSSIRLASSQTGPGGVTEFVIECR